MIKFKFQKNLIYLLIFFLSYFIRNLLNIVFEEKFNVSLNHIKIYLMTIAETFGGLFIFLYQNRSTKKNEETKYLGNDINNHKWKKVIDGKPKIIFLIFVGAFLDIFESIIKYFSVEYDAKNFSPSLEGRISSIQTITSALICTYALRFKIQKHHKASLIIISIFIFFTVLLDILYKIKVLFIGRLLLAYFFICYYMTGLSFANCIEKYLADVNFINPFKILACEGAFEIVMAILFSIGRKPFKELIVFYNNEEIKKGDKILLSFLILIYFLLSIVVNAYKIYCNVKYSPMARSLAHFFMNPFMNIYFFVKKNDFNGDIFYFIISEVICLATDFFGCVYNEYIILSCCGLEVDTIDEIIERANYNVNIPLQNINDIDSECKNVIIKRNDNKKENNNIINDDDIGEDDNIISVGSYKFSI